MSKRLKVYGWLAVRGGTCTQVRCIMAARSLREVREVCDQLRIWPGRQYIVVTGNQNEIQQALVRPGCVLFTPDDLRPAGHVYQPFAEDHVTVRSGREEEVDEEG